MKKRKTVCKANALQTAKRKIKNYKLKIYERRERIIWPDWQRR